MISRTLRRSGWLLAFLSALAVGASAAAYLSFDPDVYFQRAVYLQHQTALYLHISGALVALATLGIQAATAGRSRR